MSVADVIAGSAAVVGVLTAVLGGIIKHLLGRITKLEDAREADRKAFEARSQIFEQTLEAKQEIIREKDRQIDRLEITGVLQEKLMNALPPPKRGTPDGGS